MPAKMVTSAPRPPSRLPERPVMCRQLASVLWQGRKTPILTPVRELSGESRLIGCNVGHNGRNGMLNSIMKLAAVALAGTALAASTAQAQVKLPPSVTMTAYDTGTSGFQHHRRRRQDVQGQIRHRCARAARRQ